MLKQGWWARDIESYARYYRFLTRLKAAGFDYSRMEKLVKTIEDRWPDQAAAFASIRCEIESTVVSSDCLKNQLTYPLAYATLHKLNTTKETQCDIDTLRSGTGR
jgi:hypothetical protein